MKMLSVIACVIIVVGLSYYGVFGTNTTCTGDSDCTYSSYDNDDVLCLGYKSCWDSDLNCTALCECDGLIACHGSTIYSEKYVTCNGEYGCKYATIHSDDDIYCDGKYGCKFTDLYSDDNIYCGGEYGCRLNDIYKVNYLYVDGAGGAQNSNIYGFNRIYARGYLGLTNAYIDTTDQSKTISIFGGYQTTVDAKFVCASDTTCYIYCTSETGCEDLTVLCYGTCSIVCDDDWQSCPNETDASSHLFFQNVFDQQLQERANDRQEQYDTEKAKDLLTAPVIKDNNNNNNYLNKVNSIITSQNNINNNFQLLGAGFVGFLISTLIFSSWNCWNNKIKQYKDQQYQPLI